MLSDLFIILGIFLVFLLIAFVVGTLKKNNGLMDVFYGLGYIVIATTSLFTIGNFGARQVFMTILVFFWGMRLAIYVFARNKGKPEDYRYQAMRKRWGKNVIIKSFLRIYLFQGLIIFAVGFPVFFVNISTDVPLTLLDWIGSLIWFLGFFFETVGDHQLYKFKQDLGNKGKILDSGLWKYTQHPNYFGEVTQWWGLYIMAIGVPYGFITFFGPLIITYTIIKVSGVKLLNKRYDGDDKYQDYKQRTSTFLPWFPKKK